MVKRYTDAELQDLQAFYNEHGVVKLTGLIEPEWVEMFRSGKLTQRIRADGFATHDRTLHTENPGKTSSIAAPVLVDEREQAQLTLSFFASAMTMDDALRRFLPVLQDTAALIAGRLQARILEP